MLGAGELYEKLIFGTDEAQIWLNGYFNKKNYRFWRSENPHVTLSKPLYSQKVTVWAALSVKGILPAIPRIYSDSRELQATFGDEVVPACKEKETPQQLLVYVGWSDGRLY